MLGWSGKMASTQALLFGPWYWHRFAGEIRVYCLQDHGSQKANKWSSSSEFCGFSLPPQIPLLNDCYILRLL